MASERTGANDFPDIVGAKPENPWLATFSPYIAAETTSMRELTIRAVAVGTILGIIFGASSLYLVLKVGLTVSASIPVAVISLTLFRLISGFGFKNATILENNIVQTAGSAGESIAFGVGVTMPAILILGFDLELSRILLVSLLGGLLGILMMIPLRRALIVQQHGQLKYPEGTACAEVLKAGASDESKAMASPAAKAQEAARGGSTIGAKTIFIGFGIAFVYQVINKALYGWKEIPEKVFGAPFKAASVGAEVNPALLGVGYIIGPRIASIMCAGGVLAYLVLIPAIKFFGEGMTTVVPPGDKLIAVMSPDDIQKAYILYIGAGAVAAGGIISLFRSLPTIWHGLKGGLKDFRSSTAGSNSNPRTDQDLSMKFVVGGTLVLIALIMLFPQLHLQFNLLGAILIVAFGFLFVTVSSRLTGEIGSSSNPISGMTVATLLLTCLIFLIIGWTGPSYFVTALSIGAIVCIAASNGGTTSQDLKTGFLVGGTPSKQQIAILIGAGASALVLGPILLRLNEGATVYVPRATVEAVEPARTIDPSSAANLPFYTPESQATDQLGGYRVLAVTSENQPGAEGLNPGEYLVDGSGKVVYRVTNNFPAGLRANPNEITEKTERPAGVSDDNDYRVWHRIDPATGFANRYLVNAEGIPVYLADPGINGVHKRRPDGLEVEKFSAPKATLMSYIIKGVLDRQLPWGLVLLGVMIAVVLEMSGIPSLAFAVGVYLPLWASSPIFVGGIVRWLVDHKLRQRLAHKKLSEEELVAEGDKSPGVLMASGYIAGGAIAGIVIAFMAGVLTQTTEGIKQWSESQNPFLQGDYADLLSLLPFIALVILLYLVGRESLLAPKSKATPRT